MSRPDRFNRGVELLRKALGDEAAEQVLARHDAPDLDVPGQMLDWAVENAFGFLLQRPGLSMRDKMIALLGSDIATMASAGALRDHTRWALKSGLSADQLYEICFLLVWYCGMPKVREAMEIMKPVIEELSASGEAASGPTLL